MIWHIRYCLANCTIAWLSRKEYAAWLPHPGDSEQNVNQNDASSGRLSSVQLRGEQRWAVGPGAWLKYQDLPGILYLRRWVYWFSQSYYYAHAVILSISLLFSKKILARHHDQSRLLRLPRVRVPGNDLGDQTSDWGRRQFNSPSDEAFWRRRPCQSSSQACASICWKCRPKATFLDWATGRLICYAFQRSY